MLNYDHIFNTDINYPYHVHYIESDTSTVSINVNGIFRGYFKPTRGSSYSFSKYTYMPYSLLEYIVVGSRQIYSRALSKSIFKDTLIKYIRNSSTGNFLSRNNETGNYYWHPVERTNFYFNPFYFRSSYLWQITIGYIPSKELTTDIFSYDAIVSLVTPKIIDLDTAEWQGELEIPDIPPLAYEPYKEQTTGILVTRNVDYFIEELQDLKNGDLVSISNGKQKIEVTVENCSTSATYPAVTTTDRPIAHVPIEIINPNKKIVYSKSLAPGDQRAVDITLYDNEIHFLVQRT